jgi:hypothetical protein
MSPSTRTTRPKRRRQVARQLVTLAAVIVGGIAMYGSAAALYEIGIEDQLAAPWTLPFCLDALALVCTSAGVFAGQRNFWVRWGPRLGYAASAALQVTSAYSIGQRAPATHIAALAAACILSEVVLSMWAPADVGAGGTAVPAPRGEETGTSAPSAPKPASPAEQPAPERRPALAVVGRKSEDEIVAEVDAWLIGQERSPSKESVKAAGVALDLPCRSNSSALPILRLVKERRALAS